MSRRTCRPVVTLVCVFLVAAPYAGIVVVGVAYTLQVLGQVRVQPAVASLILSLESVFALLAGPLLVVEGLYPDVRLVDQRSGLLPYLVALVEAAAILLLASFGF